MTCNFVAKNARKPTKKHKPTKMIRLLDFLFSAEINKTFHVSIFYTERQIHRETEIPQDRETERQKGRKTAR